MTTPIDRLKELHEKATEGPWNGQSIANSGILFTPESVYQFHKQDRVNMDLVAHMRNLLPDLLELVDAVSVLHDEWDWRGAKFPALENVEKALSKLRGEQDYERGYD